MAVTSDPLAAVSDAALAIITADNDAGSAVALNNATQTAGANVSANYLVGGFIRKGDPKRTLNFPRIEVEPVGFTTTDSFGRGRFAGLLRLHIFTNRETPTGFGSQNGVALRARQLFVRATPSTTGGWVFSRLGNGRGFQAPAGPKEQHYVVEYPIQAEAGAGNF